jgi:hypothetical protein
MEADRKSDPEHLKGLMEEMMKSDRTENISSCSYCCLSTNCRRDVFTSALRINGHGVDLIENSVSVEICLPPLQYHCPYKKYVSLIIRVADQITGHIIIGSGQTTELLSIVPLLRPVRKGENMKYSLVKSLASIPILGYFQTY